jgi:hypothetical protein
MLYDKCQLAAESEVELGMTIVSCVIAIGAVFIFRNIFTFGLRMYQR